MQRLARRLAAAFAVVFVVVTSGLLGGSTAVAASPVVIGSCATTVEGAPGTPIQLAPAAVLEPVVNVVRALDPLNLITPTVKSSLAKLPPIPIGAIPTGTGLITAGQISNAVVGELKKIPVLGTIIGAVADGVQKAFSGMCGVTVKAVNTGAGNLQDATSKAADAANAGAASIGIAPRSSGGGGGTQPGKPAPGTPGNPQGGNGGGVAPGSGGLGANFPLVPGAGGSGIPYLSGWDYGRSPMTDYSSIPFAQAGLYSPSPGIRYGGGVPGYSPQFGILGTDTPPSDGVQAAGHAEALGGVPGRDIDISVLIAVLALSGVTAALVRTWVLRKAAA